MKFVGEFPIFGSNAQSTDITTFQGNLVQGDPFNFYVRNSYQFEAGELNSDSKAVRGLYKFLTSAIAGLYTQGIPEYRLGMKYPKGAVVSLNGGIYVSLIEDNPYHASQLSYWNKVALEPNDSIHNEQSCCTKKSGLDFPIGTILTVPLRTEMTGFIDYKEGETFSDNLYPELYKVLGTNQFGVSFTNNDFDSLPIGSLIHCLVDSTDVPNGWVEWKPYTNISAYPELKEALYTMASRLPNEDKTIWVSSLERNELPNFSRNGFYLKGNGEDVGHFQLDVIPQFSIETLPVVVDESNQLNPLGYRRERVDNQVYSVTGAIESGRASTIALVAHQTMTYGETELPMSALNLGYGNEIIPKTLHTRLLVKAVKAKGVNIPSTHKQIIKAFEV